MESRIPFFWWRGQTENESASSNSVFPFRRKTVGTKVHAFLTLVTNRYLILMAHKESEAIGASVSKQYVHRIFQTLSLQSQYLRA